MKVVNELYKPMPRVSLTDIGKQYGLNPDQMYAFAKQMGGYSLEGTNVDDATISVIMVRHLVFDFKKANKKGDWREKFVSESLEEFYGKRNGS